MLSKIKNIHIFVLVKKLKENLFTDFKANIPY